jgi:hypothetical protein
VSFSFQPFTICFDFTHNTSAGEVANSASANFNLSLATKEIILLNVVIGFRKRFLPYFD